MIKYLSLFSGIGAFESALKELGINYELVGFSEIDKYAIKSYCAVHGVNESLNLGDISKINIESLPTNIDLITHGSPCQDFSISGKGAGGDKNSGTRSSLMWCTVDIVKHCKPKVVIWENVKNLLSKKHRHNFDGYLDVMDGLGYNNYYKVLNSKDYGIPQNRERVFTISIRKDVDDRSFEFPNPIELKLRLKDMLEDSVDEKYYINNKKVEQLFETLEQKTKKTNSINMIEIKQPVTLRKYNVDCVSLRNCLREHKNKLHITNKYISERLNVPLTKVEHWFRKDDSFAIPSTDVWYKLKDLLNIQTNEFDKGITEFIEVDGKYEKANRVYLDNGLAPTITTGEGEKIAESPKLNLIRGIGDKDIVGDNKKLSRNYPQGKRVYSSTGIACSQTSVGGGLGGSTGLYLVNECPNFRVRKLTPLECWRLMGFKDEQFDKAQKVCSNTQLYKQAGNSIVVNVLIEIFKNINFNK